MTNKKGELKGKIRVLVPKDGELRGIALVEYVCPECEHYAYMETKWKRPFSVKCVNCGLLIRVPRLRDQAKRETKME